MNQYNNQSSSNRRKSNSGNRRDSGRSDFPKILLFYVLPFIVFNGLLFILVTSRPAGNVAIHESSDYISTTMDLKINSLLPIKSIEMKLDGTPIEAVKAGSKTYTATLTTNGMLEVRITGFNKMRNIFYEQVNVLDDTPPTIKDKVFEDGILSFRLEDSQSGVDYSSISASNEDHEEILPLSLDKSTGLITFEIKKENINITAKDKIGNELHIICTPQGDAIEDMDAEAGAEADTDTETDTVDAKQPTAQR